MLKNPIYITDSATLADGGTKYIMGIDSNQNEFSICIVQHQIEENFDTELVPGRLHFNNIPIRVRSDQECQILDALENCIINYETVRACYSDLIKSKNSIAILIKHIIDHVISEEYVKIAEQHKSYSVVKNIDNSFLKISYNKKHISLLKSILICNTSELLSMIDKNEQIIYHPPSHLKDPFFDFHEIENQLKKYGIEYSLIENLDEIWK
ncbi:hypothetical protein [Aureibacter tunicatorum]|uniref:Uncharacterized protein n=1 Tax=Aureibacter tunicatorum TaxID=866807 RepID=A0AAE4BVE4_9BACT|nr:hypothetical protein [Aureibacter tunicatorum]MDR6241812.1 hypothetical protein [Aureibacter tunicatorum]BDD07059.1 hypothetical protein AUTU_45420 [Aureibacter tunicatorum]